MHFDELEKGKKPSIPKDKNVFSDIMTLEKYGFVQKDRTLVSHLELELPKIKRAIHSITIGAKSKVNPLDMKLYLMSIGLLENVDDDSIKINRSMISYR
jgi:hypothetical protein